MTLFNVDLATQPDECLFKIDEQRMIGQKKSVYRNNVAMLGKRCLIARKFARRKRQWPLTPARASLVGKRRAPLQRLRSRHCPALSRRQAASLRFTVSTWNINSVRLRIGLVARYLQEHQPDVLCLQETKCRDAEFPVLRIS